MELHVEKQVIELLQNLTKKFDKLEGRFDGLEGRFDKLEAGQQEIVNELRDFRSEIGQNFATLVENDRNLETVIKERGN